MAKKRNKAYKPRPVKRPMVVSGFRILHPIQSIIDRLDIDGTVETVNDIPVYTDGDETYQIVPALLGLIDWLELCASHTGRALNLVPLRQLAGHFHAKEAVTVETFESCKKLLPVLQRLVAMTPDFN